MDFLPLGNLILAASTMNAADDAQATSRVFSILYRQVIIFFPLGLVSGLVTSSADLIAIVSSLASACAQRLSWSKVYVSSGFKSSPEQTTIWSDGTVMFILKSPYSR